MERKAKFNFKSARIRNNLTISELACNLKIQSSKISTWETYGNKVKEENLKKLSRALNTSLNELVFEESDNRILPLDDLTDYQIKMIFELYMTLKVKED